MSMRSRYLTSYTTLKTEGAILPRDIIQRIADYDKSLGGLTPESYHLGKTEKINEATNRAWNRLVGAWAGFRQTREKLSETDIGTRVTREQWLLPLFQELGYGRLLTTKAIEFEDRQYPISHIWQHAPIHLVGCKVDLDKRTAGVAGAAKISPHSLVQELLNRADEYLWGFVSNGLTLRILRDNRSLTRQAYIEFDLEVMMEGEAYSDFVLLWSLCHQSRVEADKPEECWLEKWSKAARDQGIRALEHLRDSVQNAISIFGAGFLSHPRNAELRRRLQEPGGLDKQDYYRQLLRLVYRLLFLLVAEDRELLLDPNATPEAKELYNGNYSVSRLRAMAEKIRGTRHSDLYEVLKLVMGKLGSKEGCPELGLPCLGSDLFSATALPDLVVADLSNSDLLEAIRTLTLTVEGRIRRTVDYKNLRAEELGSVYESLLEMHPDLNADAGRFELLVAAGHERKTTGSYYTPESLVQCLLDSALDPVLNEAASKPNPEEAILKLKVCDPACGSGHFLIAAAHRIAKRLAAVRTGDDEPSPEATRRALRDVIGRCIYGVDVNPDAVELCKVALWIEALEPGKPLSFLQHHIQCGNSLLGSTPALLKKGIPDEAFTAIEGDDKEVCKEYKKRNKKERETAQESLLTAEMKPWDTLGNMAAVVANLDAIDDNTPEGIEHKQAEYEKVVKSSGYLYGRFWADTWCAAFVWKKTKEFPYPITEEVFRRIERTPHDVNTWMKDEVVRLRSQYAFFHWHLAFPDVFTLPANGQTAENTHTGWNDGFDVLLGNPPWEKISTMAREFFAGISPIADEPRSDLRNAMISALQTDDPGLYARWMNQQRLDEGYSLFLRASGRFPGTAVGELNLYPVFVELSESSCNKNGRTGIIIKTGMLVSPTWSDFTANLLTNNRIQSAYDFRNWKGWFQGIGYHERFTLLTLRPSFAGLDVLLGYYLDDPLEMREGNKSFSISQPEILALNPITKTFPTLEGKRDKEIILGVYSRFKPLLESSCEWGVRYTRGLDLSTEASSLHDYEELCNKGFVLNDEMCFVKEGATFVPLMEGKLIHIFDHRFASFEGVPRSKRFGIKPGTHTPTDTQKSSEHYHVMPRYWISDSDHARDIESRKIGGSWSITFRDTTNVLSNFRTGVACVCDAVAFNYKAPNLVIHGCDDTERPLWSLMFVATMTSFVFDYVLRQKYFGANLIKSIILQLAVPSASSVMTRREFILPRALELSYTSTQIRSFARALGYDAPPFRWDEERRFLIRCELDAAFFHLYGIERDDVDYIMDTFPIVRKNDEKKHGEYRTKRVILEVYDAMADAISSGHPYQTIVDPPPADPSVAHPARTD